MAVRHPAHSGTQGFEAHEPERGFHAKFFVEGLLRIPNQHEWNILLVRPDRLRGGVKDDYLFDTRRFDLASTPAQLGNVRVANRAVHEPPELQMDETVRVGELDRLAGDGFQSSSRNNIAWFEFHTVNPPDHCTFSRKKKRCQEPFPSACVGRRRGIGFAAATRLSMWLLQQDTSSTIPMDLCRAHIGL